METASARKADGGQSRARSIVDRSPLSIAQDNRSGDERTTRESFERAHNLSPLIAPSLHPENVYQDRWTMIAEGRAASDASKLSTTLVDHLTKSKSRGKVSCFSPFRGRGGVSWVSWGAEWDDSREEAVQVAGMKRVSKAWGTLVERSTKIQAESGGTLVSIFRNHRGKGNVESSICSMIFHPRLYPRKLRRMNYVVQVLLVKFRSKYQSSFEFLGSLCISRWQLVYNSVIIIQWKLEFICRWRW